MENLTNEEIEFLRSTFLDRLEDGAMSFYFHGDCYCAFCGAESAAHCVIRHDDDCCGQRGSKILRKMLNAPTGEK